MSMLAGPRRKQKVINLRAKNNAWSNDSTKFGQRMLEKMGWSSGKGLGARENGIVDHVVARYKNDDRGLGFEDKNDQWTKHEDDFNALLANLSNGDEKEIALHSGVSLEDKSKKSKARIHYHKFTRGKDLSKYSEKDLANIFGKKSLKNEEKKEEFNSNPETSEKEKVFTEKGSMEDYFRSKMAAKSKMFSYNYQESADTDKDYSFTGFSGTNDEEETEEVNQGFGFGFQSFTNNDENTEKELENTAEEIVSIKKNKKKKKSKNKDNESELNAETNQSVEIDNTDLPEQEPDQIKVKKSKKKKQLDEDIPVLEPCDEEQEPPAKKKKKKAKEEITEEPEQTPEEDSHISKKKKKKKKNKDVES